jgi:hypothetical protein
MGVVYLGRDLRRDMDVAIKFRGADAHRVANTWLKREFRTVASLRHPNLVELYDLMVHDTSCYFTMEYLPGVDPRRWVERHFEITPLPVVDMSDRTTRSALPIQEAHTEMSLSPTAATVPATPRAVPVVEFARVRSVLAQLAEGLAFLHAHGVIHRDIKPSNAIVTDGNVKLLDFGLALERRRAEEELSRESRVVGTAAYLAPEYVEKLAVSPAMDVYALGVVAFELVTGAPPFGGTLHVLSRLGRARNLPRASSINADVPADLDDLIDAMLAIDPLRRPTPLQIAVRLTGDVSHRRFAAGGGAIRRAAKFVGRERELALVEACVEDPAGEGRLVLLSGPSGVGKTAVIEETLGRVRLAELQTAIWRGRCHERERVPYRAFDFVIDDLAGELAAHAPLVVSTIEHAGALARVFPALGATLDIPNTPAADDLRVERERALHAMTELFRHVLDLPRDQPGPTRGILVIDDLQWADDDSLELLALLVEKVQRPLTIVATWTTDAVPSALAALLDRLGAAAELVELAPMTPADLAEVIADLAPYVPGERLRAAAALAAGSPYLAELIGRELADDARVDSDPELRRLARLGDDERAVAEVASLAGSAATFEQLRALAELPSAQLQSALRGLEDGRIVRSTPSASGESVYVFYHQRLRDAAAAAITPVVRRDLHRRYAAVLESEGASADQLAYHYLEAGERATAARWAITAADAAHAQLAWGLAADWYGRALDITNDPALRAKRADALFLGGKLAAAAAEFETLGGDRYIVRAAEAYIKLGELERGIALLDDVLARHGEHRIAWRRRATSAARALGVSARWLVPARLRPRGEVDDVVAAAYRVIASFLSTPYPIESFEYVVRGIALAERAGDRAAHAMGMAMLAAYLAAGSLGRFGDRAIATAQRLSISTTQRSALLRGPAKPDLAESGAPYPRMVAAGAAGILATLRGNWSGMRIAHEEGHQLCKRLGMERSWEASFLRTYWALGEYYAGDPLRSLAMLGELAESSDDAISRAMLGSYRGRALVLDGNLAVARAIERELARSPLTQHGLAAVYRQVFSGELALADGDWARAAALGNELAGAARAQWLSAMPAVSAMIDVVIATAELGRAHAGDRSAATRARDRARALHRRGRASFYAATALRLWAQAEQLLGGDATELFARARTVAAERGGKIDQLAVAALTGARPELGPHAFAVRWSTGGVVG